MDAARLSQPFDELTQPQLQLLTRAERRLMAPCCYTQTIDLHSSEIAATMRQEVLQMVKSGLDETAIYAHYKALYGEQILAVPDGMLGELAFAIPLASSTLAVGILTAVLTKFHRRKLRLGAGARGVRIGPLTEAQQAIHEEIRQATSW